VLWGGSSALLPAGRPRHQSRCIDRLRPCPTAPLWTRVVWIEGSPGAIRRPPVFMPDPPPEPTRASRPRSPVHGARPLVSIDSATAVAASADPAERQEPTDASTARSRRAKRSGSGDPTERPRPLVILSNAVSPSQLGVRRPCMTLMPSDLREQAISALAYLLIAQFEREAQRHDPDAEDRGRVAGDNLRQEGQP
jgi:hypothetical protein